MSYELYITGISPPWLQRTSGVAWQGAIGRQLDALLSATRDAVKTRLPGTVGELGDTLALSHLGTERQLARYPSETDTAYGTRLRDAWGYWERAGTDTAIQRELEALGYTGVTVLAHRAFSEPPDAQTTWWSRFWVFIGDGGHTYTIGHTIGEGSLMVEGSWSIGVSATPSQVESLRRAVTQWKAALAYCVSLTLVVDGKWVGQTACAIGEESLLIGGGWRIGPLAIGDPWSIGGYTIILPIEE